MTNPLLLRERIRKAFPCYPNSQIPGIILNPWTSNTFLHQSPDQAPTLPGMHLRDLTTLLSMTESLNLYSMLSIHFVGFKNFLYANDLKMATCSPNIAFELPPQLLNLTFITAWKFHRHLKLHMPQTELPLLHLG